MSHPEHGPSGSSHTSHDGAHGGNHGEHRLGGKEVALIGLGATGAVAAGMLYLVKNIAQNTFGLFGGGGDHGHGHGHSSKELFDVGEFMASFVPTGGGGGGKSSHGGGHH